jgi:cytosine/adenosine deaminase-related metal-dependent hydrolase
MEPASPDVYAARWMLEGLMPPLEDAALAVADGMILAAGPRAEVDVRFPEARRHDLGDTVLLPGLVNAHTHLSLTGLRGRVQGGDFLGWLGTVARAAVNLSGEEVRAAVRCGIRESVAKGTVAVGDIATRPEGTGELLEAPHLAARVFFEFVGVTEAAATTRFERAVALAEALAPPPGRSLPVRPGLSPHAPYSVWPSLWRRTADHAMVKDMFWSTHLAEAPGEDRFLRNGDGPLRDYLEDLGVWDGTFPVPRLDAGRYLGPVAGPRTLFVHGVHLDDAAVERLAGTGASLCLCPRSNAFLGLPPPPVTALLAASVPLCLGTDSAASNEDLGVWGELRAVHALVPDLPVPFLLHMATAAGARALGLADAVGSLAPGRAAASVLAAPGPRTAKALADLFLSPDMESRVRRLTAPRSENGDGDPPGEAGRA